MSEMNRKGDIAFIGVINASISHELKNVLAIISESAGLLQDLCELAEDGRPLDMERVKKSSSRVVNQVRRGNGIIRNMNRFAHSTDQPHSEIDITGQTELMVEICARFAALKGMKLVFESSPECTIRTSPFLLERLLYTCLWEIMDVSSENTEIHVSVAPAKDGCCVTFSGLTPGGEPELKDSLIQGERIKASLQSGEGKVQALLPDISE